MLLAYNEKKELISLLKIDKENAEELRNSLFYCISCGEQVRLKNGQIKRTHFAHQSKTCCEVFSEGETEEHLLLKQALAVWCEQDGVAYQLEAYLPEINQRPDLLIGKLAIEVQCSPISIEKLTKRTKNYLQADYYPIWICGKKLNPIYKMKEVTKSLSYFSENIGFYLWSIDLQKKELSLLFHMEELWNNQLHFAKKSWEFNSKLLLEIFLYPNEALLFHQRKYNHYKLVQSYYQNLSKKLVLKDKQILDIQAILYNKKYHLLWLPYWFYYPGIRLFCCKKSDLLLKQKVFELIQIYAEKGMSMEKLVGIVIGELEKTNVYLLMLPNISEDRLIRYCVEELFCWLIRCDLLIKVGNNWFYNEKIISGQGHPLKEVWYHQKNKYLITATPIENMIR